MSGLIGLAPLSVDYEIPDGYVEAAWVVAASGHGGASVLWLSRRSRRWWVHSATCAKPADLAGLKIKATTRTVARRVAMEMVRETAGAAEAEGLRVSVMRIDLRTSDRGELHRRVGSGILGRVFQIAGERRERDHEGRKRF